MFANSHVDMIYGSAGTGKSTLIKVLTGVHEFESGTIHMAGYTD